MSDKLEVIKVKHDDGYMLINKKDFDKKQHELFEEIKEEKPKKKKKIIKIEEE